jgi:uncharacterized protein (UPF0335 family)
MATIEVINEFIGKVLSIENEKVLLRETEKELYADYKDQLDPKAFRAAMRIAKIRVKLSGGEEDEADQILDVLSERVFS